MNLAHNLRSMMRNSIVPSVAKRISTRIREIAARPFEVQDSAFQYLISKAKATQFGRDHGFDSIRSYEDFKSSVPLHDYEALSPYIKRIIAGEENVLWPGRPVQFAETAGTTSGNKYIPITSDFIIPYRHAGRNAVFMYIAETGNISCLAGKLLYLTHNVAIDHAGGIPVRPISSIAQDSMPFPRLFQQKFLPSDETNRIKAFEKKIDVSVEEAINQDITLMSGISPWVQLFYNKLIEKTGKPIKDIFPNFSVRIIGGVNDRPYRASLEKAIGKKVDLIEVYPASEGFIGFQDSQKDPGLLINLQGGIFYEFVPAGEIHSSKPTRIGLRDVELDVNYAIILNNNTGLWGYVLGDTVKFISKKPYRLVITGRTKHFISVAGEHVIAVEVEGALTELSNQTGLRLVDFTVAPQIDGNSGLPNHEWFIEFEELPTDVDNFAAQLNTLVCKRNINYQEYCEAKIMLPLEVKLVRRGGFVQYMRSIGKLGEQHKVPHLSNDRNIAEALTKYVEPSS